MSEIDAKNQGEPLPAAQEQVEQLTPQEVKQVKIVGAVPAPVGAPPLGLMKVDLHCHTEASPDSSTPLELISARCKKRGVRVQAITDHNVIWGAQKLQEIVSQGEHDKPYHLDVIIGEEISTLEGEIIGLFLTEPIQHGLSPEETVERIHAQGGCVLLPHGFDPLKRWRLKPLALQRIADQIDIIETFNARVSRPHWNRAAMDWAQAHNMLMSAGSDAHTLADIGSAWVEVPVMPVTSPQQLREAIKGGIPKGDWTHPVLAFAYKFWDRSLRRLTG